jgi:outer membrane protein OmpA-like peptidoglycan-associated protein
MHTSKLRSVLPLMLANVALAMSGGCGGVVKFEDTTPIAIASAAPPAPPPRVEVKADRIEINEKIQFELDKANIMEASHSLLNEITAVLAQHTEIKKVDILGHTDSDGSDAYNQDLSDRRAKAVMQYLVGHGIDQARLTAKGLGESKPIASNDTAAGKEKNRRVEFLIVEQEGGAQ